MRAERASVLRTVAVSLAVIVAALSAAAVVACAPGPDESETHSAVRTIEELLQMRADDVREPEAYAPYFEDSALATALAESEAGSERTRRVPEWETPYLSELSDDAAEVVVVWKSTEGFADWPSINIFALSLLEDRWVVADAVEATVAPEPLEESEWRTP